jgi:hypothetical protein
VGSEGIVPIFLTSTIDGGKWSASRLGRFTGGENASGTSKKLYYHYGGTTVFDKISSGVRDPQGETH